MGKMGESVTEGGRRGALHLHTREMLARVCFFVGGPQRLPVPGVRRRSPDPTTCARQLRPSPQDLNDFASYNDYKISTFLGKNGGSGKCRSQNAAGLWQKKLPRCAQLSRRGHVRIRRTIFWLVPAAQQP